MYAEVSPSVPTKQVLLVDDDLDFRARLAVPFERFGYRVNATSDVDEALLAFDAELPDVVVTSISLPQYDGLELAHRIRSRAWGGHPSIVALTTRPVSPEQELKARNAGCDVLLPRPSAPWVFVTRVDTLLREVRYLRDTSRAARERARRLSIDAERVRARAREVVARSSIVMARTAVLPVANRVIAQCLSKPGAVMSIAQVSRALNLDARTCERAMEELVHLGFLSRILDGRTYERR